VAAIKKNLFQSGKFTSHAGKELDFKVECDALTDDDIATIASIIGNSRHKFGEVVGIPRGGLRLEKALKPYCKKGDPTTLIVDDVLTTGKSFREAREQISNSTNVFGVVIFCRDRNALPLWVHPVFVLSSMWSNEPDVSPKG
jgi:hypothetical protein